MKRLIAISLIMLIGVAIGTWAAEVWIAARSSNEFFDGRLAEPRAVLPTTRCDLGIVSADMPFEARFSIHNAGKTRLIVSRQNGPCCGQSEFGEVVIVMPGRSAELVVEVDPASQGGLLEKAVTYSTNDTALPRFELKVFARISKSKS